MATKPPEILVEVSGRMRRLFDGLASITWRGDRRLELVHRDGTRWTLRPADTDTVVVTERRRR